MERLGERGDTLRLQFGGDRPQVHTQRREALQRSRRGYDTIERLDGQRTVSVTSNVNLSVAEPMQIVSQVSRDFMPELLSRYPGVKYELTGSSMEERMSIMQTGYAFLAALFGIYALMAIPLKSYVQPLIVMSVIPFGIIGAVVGVQPFGGRDLSGTGPKAGGPYYLPRFGSEYTVSNNISAVGGNATLLSLDDD